MSVVYIKKTFFNTFQYTSLEDLIRNLLTADLTDTQGQLECMQVEVDYMRDCLAKWMAEQNPTMDTLNRIFYEEVSISEISDE